MKKSVFTFLFLLFMICSHYGMTQVRVTVIQNQRNCLIPDGSASASVGGGVAGYNFDWYDVALNPLGVSGPLITNLVAGNYSVVVRQQSTGAVVGITQFTIQDETEAPVVSVESIPNTSCYSVANGAIASIHGFPRELKARLSNYPVSEVL